MLNFNFQSTIYFFFIILVSVRVGNGLWENCQEIPTRTQRAHIGWPVNIPCQAEKSPDWVYDLDSDDDIPTVECLIMKNGRAVYNKTLPFNDDFASSKEGYFIEELESTTVKNYVIELRFPSNSSCRRMDFIINATNFTQISCQQFFRNFTMSSTQADIGEGGKYFYCNPSRKQIPIYDPTNVTYQWLRNCSDLPKLATPACDNQELRIHPIDYTVAGVYTCSATYNGMTRYIISKPVCVEYPQTNQNPIISCVYKELEADVGGTAAFHCSGVFGKGAHKSTNILVQWQKVRSSGNESGIKECAAASIGGSPCTYEIVTGSCYLSIAPPEERGLKNASVEVTLTIANISRKDFGDYIVWVATPGKGFKASERLTLREEIKSKLLEQQLAIGLSISVTCLVVIIVSLGCCYNLYFKVLYKRRFGEYESEEKTYGACAVYHYSQSLDKFAQESTRTTVTTVCTLLENMGYVIYDEYKDGYNCSSRVENTALAARESHRLVLFLTHEFIKDDWTIFAVQQGFEAMINTGSRLIFVLLPGIKDYLKQHSHSDQTCRVIQRAIKTNYAIQCPKLMNKRQFRMELENAMPKLKSQKKRLREKHYNESYVGATVTEKVHSLKV